MLQMPALSSSRPMFIFLSFSLRTSCFSILKSVYEVKPLGVKCHLVPLFCSILGNLGFAASRNRNSEEEHSHSGLQEREKKLFLSAKTSSETGKGDHSNPGANRLLGINDIDLLFE